MQYDDNNIPMYEDGIIKKGRKLKEFGLEAMLRRINKNDLEYFVRVLKHSTDYFPDKGKHGEHWTGRLILSNREMNNMCLDKFKRDYELLTNPEQRKVREYIFKQLRGKHNG